ncbi:hypothetical protein AGMMS50276_29460 [Synergistales bacterium]|nr:hypothetical protein AGMMS50276_29460 [Synergistales bacterium]
MDEKRVSFTLRLPQSKAKAFRVKLANEETKTQVVLEKLVDEYLAKPVKEKQ